MDRLTGKDAQLMMEALASVYTKEEVEQEVISEEIAETELVLENEEYEKLDENLLQLLTRNRTVYRRDPKTGEKIRVQQQRDPNNLDNYIDKKTSGTGDYGYRNKRPGEAGDGTWGNFVRRKGPQGGGTSGTPSGTQQQKPRPQSPSSNLKPGSPNETKDGTKFERRLPTSAELRAAQQARRDAPKVLSRGEIENRAVKAAVGVSKGTVKDPKIAADAARKAELERIRSRAASQTKAGVRPTVASTADPKTPSPVNSAKPAPKPAPKPAAGSPAAQAAAGAPNRKEDLFTGKPIPSAKPAAAAPAPAPVVKKKPAMGARNRMRMEEVDIFDTIKEYLIGEGATEEEALKQMLTLTDEQRTEILEAEVFRNRKPFSDAGEYPMRDAMRDAGMNRAPNAPVVPVKKAKKKPTTQMAGYEPEGELVDEGSCGSKKKKKSRKGGY